ncbi:Cell wall protein SED1 [Cytospora mali]|uniref:Cell wall protein SED1 n=1 Tax=Cytospora mali TaxID=578113 RepID=A0A194W486_CYTMA|nr:Cell wall protein SED1 [Valsa mali]
MQVRNALIALGAASMAAAQNTTLPAGHVFPNATAVLVVDYFTTWCPEATVLTYNGKYYTATGPTELTITDCPCTITTTGPVWSKTASATGETWTSGTWETWGGYETTGTAESGSEASSTSWATTKTAGTGAGTAGVATVTSEVTAVATKVGGTTAQATYAQSGASENHARVLVGLAFVLASAFFMNI